MTEPRFCYALHSPLRGLHLPLEYAQFEVIVFWGLLTLPVLVLVPTANAVHVGRRAKMMARFLLLGMSGSLIYGIFAVFLVLLLFPQPESSGAGLDLSGLALYFGSWGGGSAGTVTTLICVAVSTMVHWVHRRTSSDIAATPAS